MSATVLTLGSVLLAVVPAVAVQTPEGPARTTAPGVYVVTLSASPAAVARPGRGVRFDRTRPAVVDYTAGLLRQQDQVLRRVGDPVVLYRYTTALNGFAVTLTSEQVRRLRAAPAVVGVERSSKQHIDRALSASGTAAAARSGAPGTPTSAGRGVVVGVVDSGIWSRNPSFTGLADRTPGTAPGLPGFHGGCAAGEEWTVEDCSDKVVAARWFVNGFGGENTATAEYLSPRDGNGHGSHVASTAAGDHGVRVEIDGERFASTSGMAPAARLAVYKACWSAPDPADDGCTTADSVAAIDAAVADGVDVLSYSVSGGDRRDDAVESAFLGAASAGVVVTTSAGNRGPAHGTVGHVAPWVTTVAASTHHGYRGTVRLGDGRRFTGAMVSNSPVPSTRLVLGGAARAPGATAAAARFCQPGSLDPARVQDAVVVCERGQGARVTKSGTVADAGGAGMVLADTRRDGTDADVHDVPTVHLDRADSRAVRGYASGRGARASLRPGARDLGPPALAGFSARGPVEGNVLKPDLTAPGVSVLGAVAPPSDSGRSWDLVSGTSTSTPHVAGLAAYVLGRHPRWSPARVKSAMMTTASDVSRGATPLGEGAGHVEPSRVLDPGLVFDTAAATWRRLAAGRLSAREVNAASLALGDLVGPTTVTRRLTNVSTRPESYAVHVTGLRGVDVQAYPATIRLAPGQSRSVRLRVTARPTATADRDVTGWLVWRGDRHRVRVPVTVRPTVVAAPERVDGSGDVGRVVVRGHSGNGRTVKLHSTGLVASRSTPVSGRTARTVRVPAGTDLARFAASSHVDLSVYRGDALVGRSTRGASEVTLDAPRPGDYRVLATTDEDTYAHLDTWVVPRSGGSKVELSTDAVGFAPGRKFRYSASWDDLDPGKHYLGVVGYGDSDRRTLVEVRP